MGLFSKKVNNNVMYAYTNEESRMLENFIRENYGDFELVLHEIVSKGIHLDIAIVPPTEKNNYYKLITMGMGAYTMNVPNELKPYNLERAELVLYLPADWKIDSELEEDYWPIRYLKILARLPFDHKTWLGFGHTVSANNDNSPYADNTNFCSTMLLTALNNNNQKLNFNLKNKGKINFYQLYPIYKEELEYKINNDSMALLNLISDKDLSPVLNIKRKNYGLEKPKQVKEIKKVSKKKEAKKETKTTKKSTATKKPATKKSSAKSKVNKTKTKVAKKVVEKKIKKEVKKVVKNTAKKTK